MKLTDSYNLETLYPELSKQWHPTKNGDLKPCRVTPGSGVKVWWKCKEGHEWISMIANRTNGNGCPFCAHSHASDEYNLQIMNPELAKQWHPTENGDLKPGEVTHGSEKKVWWLCEKGHKWREKVWYRNRNAGIGCPYCQGRKNRLGLDEYNLQVTNPSLAKQWHPTENGGLKPGKVKPSSNMKVWWLCEEGHKWREKIGYRNRYAGVGCPYCRSRDVSDEYNLQVTNPSLAKQWHPTKNGDLSPDKVTHGSRKKVWWLCGKGHQWKAVIDNRSMGQGCPYCYSRTVMRKSKKRNPKEINLLAVHPELAKQWHPIKNGNLKPDGVAPGANKKVWWICDNGHEWEAVIKNWNVHKVACPFCRKLKARKEHNLLAVYPGVAEQWHREKNGDLRPDKVAPRSGIKVWWKCDKGHEWESTILIRVRQNGCPYCAGKKVCPDNNLLFAHPGIAKQWHPKKNGTLTPVKVTGISSKKVWWRCEKGHEWIDIVSSRARGKGCPLCRRERVLAGNNLQMANPGLARQWHPTKNGDLTPGRVTHGSNMKVWWICNKGHEWMATIGNRTKGRGCPFCAHKHASDEYNLETLYPEVAKQWHPTKNGDLKPGKVIPGSKKKAWRLCENGHQWQTYISYRTSNTGSACPICRKK
ncbi:MAG: zinc-ribbon domain-containing protein [bacterium]|nr:zinc-ribbon domain-containing protein [bacterium]